jgi:hypothetical protein
MNKKGKSTVFLTLAELLLAGALYAGIPESDKFAV